MRKLGTIDKIDRNQMSKLRTRKDGKELAEDDRNYS